VRRNEGDEVQEGKKWEVEVQEVLKDCKTSIIIQRTMKIGLLLVTILILSVAGMFESTMDIVSVVILHYTT